MVNLCYSLSRYHFLGLTMANVGHLVLVGYYNQIQGAPLRRNDCSQGLTLYLEECSIYSRDLRKYQQ